MNVKVKNTVVDFVNKYKTVTSVKTKQGMINSIEIKSYIPYERKADICKMLVNNTSYEKQEDGTKVFKKDSVAEYMMWCLILINEYTSLEVDYKNNVEEFNLLNEPIVEVEIENGKKYIGIMDALISKISEKEVKEFNMILNFTKDDLMQNEYELHSFITNKVNTLSQSLSIFFKAAEPILSKLLEQVNNMDEKDAEKLGKKITKIFK